MPSTTTTWQWHPEKLNAALYQGMRDSVRDAGAVAKVKNPWPSHIKVAAFTRDTTGYIIGKGSLAHIAEEGADPHVILPRGLTTTATGRKRRGKKALAGGGLRHPISGPINHPGLVARPFIKPATDYWVNFGYRKASTAALARAGFRAVS